MAVPVKNRKPGIDAGRYSYSWCRRPDSNRHELSPATPSRWCVYQIPPLRPYCNLPIGGAIVKLKEARRAIIHLLGELSVSCHCEEQIVGQASCLSIMDDGQDARPTGNLSGA